MIEWVSFRLPVVARSTWSIRVCSLLSAKWMTDHNDSIGHISTTIWMAWNGMEWNLPNVFDVISKRTAIFSNFIITLNLIIVMLRSNMVWIRSKECRIDVAECFITQHDCCAKVFACVPVFVLRLSEKIVQFCKVVRRRGALQRAWKGVKRNYFEKGAPISPKAQEKNANNVCGQLNNAKSNCGKAITPSNSNRYYLNGKRALRKLFSDNFWQNNDIDC